MAASMASAKIILGGAGAAALTVRVTRSLYQRWHVLPAAERERMAPVADEAKRSALDLRGAVDLQRAQSEARAAGERLAAALLESAVDDPQLDEAEVAGLRADLRRELDRLADADIKASRSAPGPATPQG
jgi:hypothetical protein